MYVSQFTTTKDLLVAEPKQSAQDVFFQMRERGIRHAPVVSNGDLVGVLSDREMRRPRWIDETPDLLPFYDLSALLVEDVMEPNVHSLKAHDALSKAVELFAERRYGAAPVVDKNGELFGMLSVVDVLRAFGNILGDLDEGRVTTG